MNLGQDYFNKVFINEVKRFVNDCELVILYAAIPSRNVSILNNNYSHNISYSFTSKYSNQWEIDAAYSYTKNFHNILEINW